MFATIYVEKAAHDLPLTQQTLKRNPGVPVISINSTKDLPKLLPRASLVIKINPGRFLEKCPGTPQHICCNYYVLNWAIGCPYNCSYCFLHGYKNSPGQVILHANLEDLLREVENWLKENPNKTLRLGTGEFTDSWALEQATGFNELLIPPILAHKKVTLELKTKSAELEPQDLNRYQDYAASGQLVWAWSLNAEVVTTLEEQGAADFSARLRAAKLAQGLGFKVALHFDPLIACSQWPARYAQAVQQVADTLRPDRIAWISLGALRYTRQVKSAAQKKFPASNIFYGELLAGLDHKFRYFRFLRLRMFRHLVQLWRDNGFAQAPIYLCMETPEMWQDVFGAQIWQDMAIFKR